MLSLVVVIARNLLIMIPHYLIPSSPKIDHLKEQSQQGKLRGNYQPEHHKPFLRCLWRMLLHNMYWLLIL